MPNPPVFNGKKPSRPKAFPPPEFPPRKVALFAKTPPTIFGVILGLLGMGLAARAAVAEFDLPRDPVEGALGLILGLWAFAILAIVVKLSRRTSVLYEDLRVLPGRSGMAACTMSIMAAAAVLAPYAPSFAGSVLWVGLGLHGLLAVVQIWVLAHLPAEARQVNPVWQQSFVGFIVGAVTALALGETALATAIFYGTMIIAAGIWGLQLAQLIGRIPPAPLRPLLAIHLAPAALFSITAQGLGEVVIAQSFAAFASVIAVGLLVSVRWLTAAGFSAMWGAFTFPQAAYAAMLLGMGGVWAQIGLGVLGFVLLSNTYLAWRVLKMWATGALAAKTNAAEA